MTSYFSIKYTLIICFLLSLYVFSQDLSETESIMLNEVELASEHSYADSRSYLLLKRRVIKVYPYVDTISVLLDDADSALKGIQKKRLSRRYSRKLQKKIMRRFSEKITNLTRKEGVVLSKIIYREFGITVYDLISQYRGSVHAFFWQRLAKLYDGDLRSNFDPESNKEDFFIEYIINEYIETSNL